MKYKILKAVHEDDLDGLLKKLGIFDDFSSEKIKCYFCNDHVNYDNLYSLLPLSGSIKLVCTKILCIKSLSKYLIEKKYKIS